MAANPCPSARIPKLCLHKASGRAVVRLDGRDVYCGPYGTAAAKAEYDRAVSEWLLKGVRTPPAGRAPAAGLSVAELLLAYKNHADDYYRDSPAEREKIRLALRPLRELYALTTAAAFGPLALKAVRERLLAPRQRTAGKGSGRTAGVPPVPTDGEPADRHRQADLRLGRRERTRAGGRVARVAGGQGSAEGQVGRDRAAGRPPGARRRRGRGAAVRHRPGPGGDRVPAVDRRGPARCPVSGRATSTGPATSGSTGPYDTKTSTARRPWYARS